MPSVAETLVLASAGCTSVSELLALAAQRQEWLSTLPPLPASEEVLRESAGEGAQRWLSDPSAEETWRCLFGDATHLVDAALLCRSSVLEAVLDDQAEAHGDRVVDLRHLKAGSQAAQAFVQYLSGGFVALDELRRPPSRPSITSRLCDVKISGEGEAPNPEMWTGPFNHFSLGSTSFPFEIKRQEAAAHEMGHLLELSLLAHWCGFEELVKSAIARIGTLLHHDMISLWRWRITFRDQWPEHVGTASLAAAVLQSLERTRWGPSVLGNVRLRRELLHHCAFSYLARLRFQAASLCRHDEDFVLASALSLMADLPELQEVSAAVAAELIDGVLSVTGPRGEELVQLLRLERELEDHKSWLEEHWLQIVEDTAGDEQLLACAAERGDKVAALSPMNGPSYIPATSDVARQLRQRLFKTWDALEASFREAGFLAVASDSESDPSSLL